ncbi:HNH endonuclease [Blastopirellula marina]|uniref:Uncharacterized protein n=1 Tax=Blastopirellula marina TaxID=124 RepID=A0A2S8GII8_9BACT|nr:HNH endonuclease [Blastopirellula marina]PQO43844.1 hypothetical protein C5Y93_21905 [Blastopirellula marina]
MAQVTYQQELQDDELASGAEAKRDAALLALDLAQIENTANADYQYAQTLAAGLQTYGDASIQADYGYSVQLAGAIYAANQSSAQSEMTLSLGIASASDLATVDTNSAVNEVTRRLAVNDAQHDSNVAAAQLSGVTTIDGLLDSDYTAFLVAKFTGQQSAAANLVAETTDWALDNIDANVAYAALAATAESVYVNLRETTIFAHQLLAAASEKLNEDQIAASYQANGTQLSAAIAAYQTAEAVALRDHRIAVEQADRRLTADGDQTAHDAAVAAADQALADAKAAFTSAYYAAAISAEGDYQADIALADAQYVNNVGQSRIRSTETIADAQVDYVATEAAAYRTQWETIAARDEAFAEFDVNNLYDATVASLAAVSNPWATKALSIAAAVKTGGLAVVAAVQDYAQEEAAAQEAREVANANAERDRVVEETKAEVHQQVAQNDSAAERTTREVAVQELNADLAPINRDADGNVDLNTNADGVENEQGGDAIAPLPDSSGNKTNSIDFDELQNAIEAVNLGLQSPADSQEQFMNVFGIVPTTPTISRESISTTTHFVTPPNQTQSEALDYIVAGLRSVDQRVGQVAVFAITGELTDPDTASGFEIWHAYHSGILRGGYNTIATIAGGLQEMGLNAADYELAFVEVVLRTSDNFLGSSMADGLNLNAGSIQSLSGLGQHWEPINGRGLGSEYATHSARVVAGAVTFGISEQGISTVEYANGYITEDEYTGRMGAIGLSQFVAAKSLPTGKAHFWNKPIWESAPTATRPAWRNQPMFMESAGDFPNVPLGEELQFAQYVGETRPAAIVQTTDGSLYLIVAEGGAEVAIAGEISVGSGVAPTRVFGRPTDEAISKATQHLDDNMATLVRKTVDKIYENKKWSWGDIDASLTKGSRGYTARQKAIRDAIKKGGLVPDIEFTGKFADFGPYVKHDLTLPEHLWSASDPKQVAYLDEQIGGTVEGFTWHHHQDPGRMQLVPQGLHAFYGHHGGRSPGGWAYVEGLRGY